MLIASKNNPKGRENDIVLQQLKDEILIYDLTINKAYSLNETSALVWNLCDGNNSVADISGQLSKKLNQPVTDDLVWLALDQLKADNLLTDNEQVEIKFDGLSRREVIRKVGLASLIAIPIIISIIAPVAVVAQSCNTLGQACTGSFAQGSCCTSTLRCDLFAGNTCVNCFSSGTAFGSCLVTATCTDAECNAASTKARCCNSGLATHAANGNCLCP